MATKTKTDPTGQRIARKRASKRIDKRLNTARSKVLKLFRSIPRRRSSRVKINQETTIYTYDITADQLQDIEIRIRNILDEELEVGSDRLPPEWFYKPNVEEPYRQGTVDEIVQFNQLIAAAIVAGILGRGGLPPQRIPAELVLTSPGYLQALNNVYVRNYAAIKSLSEKVAAQVIERIDAGIAAKQTPTQIAADITSRFDVAKSSAQRIASTEVNWAYNRARLNAVELAADQSGLRAGVIHISALTTTTRTHHAARHGNAYTVEDQQAWWAEGANLINCKCTTRSVLVDKSGNVVQKEAQEAIKKEGEEFF